MYAAALTALFSDYSNDVIEYATDPRTGLATRFKWMPMVAEVRDFLEECMRPRRTAEASRERAARQLAERPVVIDRAPFDVPAHARCNLFVPQEAPQYAETLAKHRETGGKESYADTRTCSDGIKRSGLMVPLGWINSTPARDVFAKTERGTGWTPPAVIADQQPVTPGAAYDPDAGF